MLRAEEMDEKEIMENELKAHDLYNKVRSKLPQLDIKYQEVIALRYFEQKTNKEVSEILNKNEGTVKSLLSRGLEKLRKLI
jgi:RNA polymerase sigma-70 factor (ECF subfamily)